MIDDLAEPDSPEPIYHVNARDSFAQLRNIEHISENEDEYFEEEKQE